MNIRMNDIRRTGGSFVPMEHPNQIRKKSRNLEIRERALAILNVHSAWDQTEIKRNFRRQIRLVNPSGPKRVEKRVPGYDNSQVARLLIQAYNHLIGRNGPTTMLEDDGLVGLLLGGRITPLDQTTTYEEWNALQYYDQFRKSVWPAFPSAEEERKWKFGGIC